MSFGLTQYDVEDLVRYSKDCCECCLLLGLRRFSLLQQPLLRLILCHAVTQREIEALYQRFRSLDRGHKVAMQHTVCQTIFDRQSLDGMLVRDTFLQRSS